MPESSVWKKENESRRIVFDIETDGFLDALSIIHSLVLKDIDTGEVLSCSPYNAEGKEYLSVATGLRELAKAGEIIGHNIMGFDIPAIQKIYPDWKPQGTVRDTLVISRLIYPDMLERDYRRQESYQKQNKQWIEGKLFGNHSLESWGQRLGLWKGDYGQIRKAEGKALGLTGDALAAFVWGEWSVSMQDYCEQDVEVTEMLYRKLLDKGFSEESINLEHDVRRIVDRQEAHGFKFDTQKAERLYAVLAAERDRIDRLLQKEFRPWWRPQGTITTKNDRTASRPDLGQVVLRRFSDKTGSELKPYEGPVRESYFAGSKYVKIKLLPFNPGSRMDIADRLTKLYGWKPKEFTPDGGPKVDEEVLSSLKYPAAKLLTDYLMIQKRIGQLSEGKMAWMKKVGKDGRIHGRVNTNGAVTGRMTHSNPNMAQVPSSGAPYGEECRALFCVPKGKLLVGCDADGLELRDLAGYMARYDGGAYVRTVLEGKKEDGTDMHTLNAKALDTDRNTAKTWFYAFIYGAGDFKLGLTLGAAGSKQQIMAAGKASRAKFLAALPALGKITERVKAKAKTQGTLKGLDGRILPVRSEHSALNTLLQSAGAIQMKKALVILDEKLQEAGLVPGENYEFVGNIHDEWQIEVDEDKAEFVGRTAADSIRLSGEYFSFNCPLSGSFAIGTSWAETH